MATQFYSALHYLNTHHDFVPVNDSRPVSDPQGSHFLPWAMLTLNSYACYSRGICWYYGYCAFLTVAAKKELARDLILKTKEIDLLIGSLPGIGVSEEQQIQRLQKLEEELQNVEKKRKEIVTRKDELQKRLDEVIQTVAVNAKGRP